jgi:diacylglycerol kinase (ATP)
VNPAAGQHKPGQLLPRLRACLSEWCPDFRVRETTARGDAEQYAREMEPGRFDAIIAVGGDGTINEVVNGLTLDGTPLGIIPLGTANVLARELKIPVNDLRGACDLLRDGASAPIDVGECNGRRFTLMTGIGFDAEAVQDVLPNVKDLLGAPAYVLAGLQALSELPQSLRYDITLPDRRLRMRGMMLVAANAASYAGPWRIAPLAQIDDGALDLCLFRESNKLAFLGQLVRVMLRRQLQDPRFVYLRATWMRVECQPPAAIQLDGDYFGGTPAEIRVLPGALPVIRPPRQS